MASGGSGGISPPHSLFLSHTPHAFFHQALSKQSSTIFREERNSRRKGGVLSKKKGGAHIKQNQLGPENLINCPSGRQPSAPVVGKTISQHDLGSQSAVSRPTLLLLPP